MIVTRAALEQLEREARQLDHAAQHASDLGERERLKLEARARRERIHRLQTQRTDGVRFG